MRYGRLWRSLAFMCLVFFMSGCGRINPQADAESRFANDVIVWMKQYRMVMPDVPITNLSQVLTNAKYGYPYFHHIELSGFKDHAGFRDSVAEKYMFVWPRI